MADTDNKNPRRQYYLKNYVKGTPVCPYHHDHYAGVGYEDCVIAFETEKARLERKAEDKP